MKADSATYSISSRTTHCLPSSMKEASGLYVYAYDRLIHICQYIAESLHYRHVKQTTMASTNMSYSAFILAVLFTSLLCHLYPTKRNATRRNY